MRVVDPHLHLWDTRKISYPWLACPKVTFAGDNRLLPKQHDVAAFLNSTQDIDVLMSVNVEANPMDPLAEARWLQHEAVDPKNRGHPHGIVAYADLSSPNVGQLLESLAVLPNLRGIRQILNVHANPNYNYVNRDFLHEPLWRENLQLLAQYGWSFDLQIYPSQAVAAAEVVAKNPRVNFLINHACMFVDRSCVKGWAQWRGALRALASNSNATIKLSGFAMFDHHWTTESVRPYVLEAIDAFGTERAMFASNFPIDGLHGSYGKVWHAYADIVSGATDIERENLFANNAARCYRLGACIGKNIE